MTNIFNISYQDICYSSTLELTDMGKQAKIVSGCIQIVGSGDSPVLCPDDFITKLPCICPNNGKSTLFNKGKLNVKSKTLYMIGCADNVRRRVYHNNNAGYFYIVVKGVKMRIHSKHIKG